MLTYEKTITFDTFVRWLGYGLLVVGVFLFLYYLSGVLLPFAVGWLLAYLPHPAVKFVQFKMRVRNRVLSIIITLIVVLIVVVGVLWLIIPPMIGQFEKLGQLASNYIQQKANVGSVPEAIRLWTDKNRENIDMFLHSSEFREGLKSLVPNIFQAVGKTANIIISIIGSLIALLYMFFILMDYDYLTKAWVKLFPKKSRPFWNELASDAERALSNYIRGQGTVALIMGILFCIGFTIIDFPMAIGLGILIGIMDLVPYLHTLALVPTALLALLKAADTGQNFWLILLSALAVFAIVQVIIDMIVTPKVMGKAMGLNPAILLLSLSVWGVLLGFIGLIIALPLTTLLMAYYQRYVTKDEEEDEQLLEAGSPPTEQQHSNPIQ